MERQASGLPHSLLQKPSPSGDGVFTNNLGWRIPEGAYEVITQIDRRDPQKVNATGQGQVVAFEFWFNEPTINLLSYGMKLYVTVGQSRYEYHLDRSEGMLKALVQCAVERLPSANPFVKLPPTPSGGCDPMTNPHIIARCVSFVGGLSSVNL